MPNIEIHGAGGVNALNLKKDIFEAIKKINPQLANEAVVTICTDTCVDIKGNNQPFLRIYSSNPAHFEPLEKALRPLKIDIEILPLSKFIPAYK